MDWANPFRSLIPTVEADVLSVLAVGEVRLTGREVARRLPSRSYEGVRRALARLVEQGLVERERFGRAQSFRLNRQHLLAPAIAEISAARARLVERLAHEINAWEVAPLLVVIFGSVASGKGRPDSDVDVLVVSANGADTDGAAWGDQLLRMQLLVRTWTGNDVRILEYTESDFAIVEHGAVVEAMDRGIAVHGSLVAARRLRRRGA